MSFGEKESELEIRAECDNKFIKYNHPRRTIQTNATGIGDTEVNLRGRDRGLYHQFPSSIGKYVIGGSILLGALIGMEYLTDPNPDVYHKVESFLTPVVISLSMGIYLRRKLSKKYKIL